MPHRLTAEAALSRGRIRSIPSACNGQGGDEPDLDLASLYRRLQPALLRHLRRIQPGGAENLAADVWLEAAAGLPRFRGDGAAFAGWLFTLASRAIDAHRRVVRRRTDPVDADDLDRWPGPDRPEIDTLDGCRPATPSPASGRR